MKILRGERYCDVRETEYGNRGVKKRSNTKSSYVADREI